MRFFLLIFFAIVIEDSKGILTFPGGTTNGYIVAVALPIDIPDRNVFVSFNLEANYALPTQSTYFTQGLYDKILFLDGVEEETEDVDTGVSFEARETDKINLFSRKNVYELIERKLDIYGFNGHACLLRTICEISNIDLTGNNGIFGSLVHILFSPSASLTEINMEDYIDAENSHGSCQKYTRSCSFSLLNAFSVFSQ